jgi:hypothetical protein
MHEHTGEDIGDVAEVEVGNEVGRDQGKLLDQGFRIRSCQPLEYEHNHIGNNQQVVNNRDVSGWDLVTNGDHGISPGKRSCF